MAGIGFALQRLAQTDRFSAKLHGFAHAIVVSSGPWLFTCLALVGIEIFGRPIVGRLVLQQFSILTVYNFSFSLVVTGPIVLVITRCVSDAIYANDVSQVSDMLLAGLALVFGVTALFGVPLYGVVLELPLGERLLSLAGMLLAGGMWLAAAFVLALKSYRTITLAFAGGMIAAVGSAALLAPRFGESGLVAGFTLGLSLSFFTLVGRILYEFPASRGNVFAVLRAFPQFWQLALVGLVYNAAIWVDKWIMWFAPRAIEPGPALLANPAYEGAMFLAYLSIVPSMALLIIDIETRFYPAYVRFYRDISAHASFDDIRTNHRELIRVLASSLRRTAAFQGAICLVALLVAPALISAAGGGLEMITIFRFGVLGACFHMLLMMTMTALAYFDLRRALMAVAVTFLFLNAGLTALAAWLGQEYQGYGYFLAAAISFAVAFFAASARVNRLPYLTFVANNPALRGVARSR